MKKISIAVGLSLMVLFFTGCASTGNLNESQKIGVKNSPAALMTIRFSDGIAFYQLNDAEYTKFESGKQAVAVNAKNAYFPVTQKMIDEASINLKQALETEGGFTFADPQKVDDGIANGLKKMEKEAKWNKIKSIGNMSLDSMIKGAVSTAVATAVIIGVAETVDALGLLDGSDKQKTPGFAGVGMVKSSKETYSIVPKGYRNLASFETIAKEVKKSAKKVQSYVYCVINLKIHTTPDVSVPTRIASNVQLFIVDAEGKILDETYSVALSDAVPYREFEENPSILLDQMPTIINNSIDVAAKNLHAKTGRLKILKVESDTKELVGDSGMVGYLPIYEELNLSK